MHNAVIKYLYAEARLRGVREDVRLLKRPGTNCGRKEAAVFTQFPHTASRAMYASLCMYVPCVGGWLTNLRI
jgi:hypothetical protein